MATLLEAVTFSEIVYRDNPSATPKNWEFLRPSDPSTTGFYAEAFRNTLTGEILVVYRGTEFNGLFSSRTDWKDIGADVDLVLSGGNNTRQNGDAQAFLSRILSEHPDARVSCVGQSLGGNLCTAGAASPELQAYPNFTGGMTTQAPGVGAGALGQADPAPFDFLNLRAVGDPLATPGSVRLGVTLLVENGGVGPPGRHSVTQMRQYLEAHPELGNMELELLRNMTPAEREVFAEYGFHRHDSQTGQWYDVRDVADDPLDGRFLREPLSPQKAQILDAIRRGEYVSEDRGGLRTDPRDLESDGVGPWDGTLDGFDRADFDRIRDDVRPADPDELCTPNSELSIDRPVPTNAVPDSVPSLEPSLPSLWENPHARSGEGRSTEVASSATGTANTRPEQISFSYPDGREGKAFVPPGSYTEVHDELTGKTYIVSGDGTAIERSYAAQYGGEIVAAAFPGGSAEEQARQASSLGPAEADPRRASAAAVSSESSSTTGGPAAWYSGENATVNAYASGLNSAIAFLQALQQGNELSAALSGVSMANAFARADGIAPVFSATTTAGLGALSAGLNLYDAVKGEDPLGALTAGTSLSAQATALWAESLAADAQVLAQWGATSAAELAAYEASQMGSLSSTLGIAAGALGLAWSLERGDEVGVASSGLVFASQLSWIGPWGALAGIAIGIADALFGNHEPPEIKGSAEVRWSAKGELTVAITESREGGGQTAHQVLADLLAPLKDWIATQVDESGSPVCAIIPQRLPSVSYHAQYDAALILNYAGENGELISRHYDSSGSRNFEGERNIAEEFIARAIESKAIVPKWEADTILAHWNQGDFAAWMEEAEGAGLPRAAEEGLTQTYSVLTLDFGSADDSRLTTHVSRFDVDADGYLEATDWINANQAILAIDRDLDGAITAANELLTLDPEAAEGRARNSLSWLDATGEGIVDRQDPAFAALRVWLDVNANAISEPEELFSLTEAGIAAIDFTQYPPAVLDAEGSRYALTKQWLTAEAEGANVASDDSGTLVELEARPGRGSSGGGGQALYLRAGDTRIVSAPREKSLRDELDEMTESLTEEVRGLFLASGGLLTAFALGQTSAAELWASSRAPDTEHMIEAAREAQALFAALETPGSRWAQPAEGAAERAAPSPLPTRAKDDTPAEAASRADSAQQPQAVELARPPLAGEAPARREQAVRFEGAAATAGGDERGAAAPRPLPHLTRPLVSGELVETLEDATLIIHPAALLANDFSRNPKSVLHIAAVGDATHGQLSMLASGELVFVPEPNYYGEASFRYLVVDGYGLTAEAEVRLKLAPVNDAPVITAIGQQPLQWHESFEDRKIGTCKHREVWVRWSEQDGWLLAEDVDDDPKNLTLELARAPEHGHVGLGPQTPQWGYGKLPWLAPPAAAAADSLEWHYRSDHGNWDYPGDPYLGPERFVLRVVDPAGAYDEVEIESYHSNLRWEDTDRRCPVALDLDGGGVGFVSLEDSGARFDVDGDGAREPIAWVGKGDGLLALDLKGDRQIESMQEISFVSYQEGARTDLEGLRAFDTNLDGKLSALDRRFGDFGIWQDADGDGLCRQGEFRTLKEAGIAEISLTSDGQYQDLGDVTVFGRSRFTDEDGRTGELADVALRYTKDEPPPGAQATPPDNPPPTTEAEIARAAALLTEMAAALSDPDAEPLGFVPIGEGHGFAATALDDAAGPPPDALAQTG